MANVHRIGFTQLSANSHPPGGPYRVNVILVHGLRGHPRGTWEDSRRQSKSYERSVTQRKRSVLKSLFKPKLASLATIEENDSSDGVSIKKVFWPYDYLVSDLPDARIWTYGYEADVIGGIFEANNENSVSQHGRDLAVKLERDVDNEDPIVFVAHNLGGIIVKDALRRSKSCCPRTRLVVFLGTPHRGSSLAEWGVIASNLASLAMQTPNKGIVKTVEVNSEVLDNIQDEFQRLVLEKNIQIHSFQEARGISGMKGLSGKVVNDFSSKVGLPIETVETIDANHIEMARCTDKADPQYRSILAVLRQFVRVHLTEIKLTKNQANAHTILSSSSTAGTVLEADPPAGNASRVVFRPLLAKNKNFVGRSATLTRLQDMLFVSKVCQNLALIGLGGVGKTQVALQLAYWVEENKPEFSIFWISALSLASFEQGYTDIARQVHIQTAEDEDFKDSVRQHLELDRSRKWFLIVDNADDLTALFGSSNSKAGFHKYLPVCENCVILFTTRSREVAVSVANENILELKEMNRGEATSLLTRSLIQKQLLQDEKVTDQLLEELTYLPLAITQAAAYLNRNQVSIRRYVELLHGTEKEAVNLLSRVFRDKTRYLESESTNAVATTWLVSFDQIRINDPPAADLLSFISLIEPRAIPRSLLPHAQTEETENAIGTLRGYAFLNSNQGEDLYDVHRLVHMASRIWNKTQNCLQQTTDNAIQHLNAIFPTSHGDNRELWRSYLPHATRLLQGSEESSNEEKYNLYYAVGRCLAQDRRTKEAINCFSVVHRYHLACLPEDDHYRLTVEHHLASQYLDDRQIKEAIAMFEQIVKIQKLKLDEKDSSRLASEHELARAYLEDRQIKEAISIFEHVVEMEREMLDEKDHSRFMSEHELARAYLEDRRIKEAISIFERVVEMEREMLDEKDHSRFMSEHELARAYLEDRRIKEAISIFERVVEIEREMLGEKDHSRLASEHELARAYLEDRRIKEAILILEHVVEIHKETLDEKDHSRLWSEHELARAYLEDGGIEEAISILEHVVETRRETLDEKDHSRLCSEHELARAYLNGGRIKKAISIFEHVVKLRRETLDEKDHFRLTSEHVLARAYLDGGQIKEAISVLEHVVELRKQTLDEDDQSLLSSEQALKTAYKALHEDHVELTSLEENKFPATL